MATTKFKVGDKVRCIEVYGHETPPIAGVEYTVERIETGFPVELSLEGVRGGHYAYRFELATPDFKPGDRVAVAFEDVITSVSSDTAFFGGGLATLAAPLSSLTKLTDPIPTADGAVIHLDASVYKLGDDGYWEGIGSVANYSHREIQGWADTYGFTILYAGDES